MGRVFFRRNINESSTLNEIGNTPEGQFMLGRVKGRQNLRARGEQTPGRVKHTTVPAEKYNNGSDFEIGEYMEDYASWEPPYSYEDIYADGGQDVGKLEFNDAEQDFMDAMARDLYNRVAKKLKAAVYREPELKPEVDETLKEIMLSLGITNESYNRKHYNFGTNTSSNSMICEGSFRDFIKKFALSTALATSCISATSAENIIPISDNSDKNIQSKTKKSIITRLHVKPIVVSAEDEDKDVALSNAEAKAKIVIMEANGNLQVAKVQRFYNIITCKHKVILYLVDAYEVDPNELTQNIKEAYIYRKKQGCIFDEYDLEEHYGHIEKELQRLGINATIEYPYCTEEKITISIDSLARKTAVDLCLQDNEYKFDSMNRRGGKIFLTYTYDWDNSIFAWN